MHLFSQFGCFSVAFVCRFTGLLIMSKQVWLFEGVLFGLTVGSLINPYQFLSVRLLVGWSRSRDSDHIIRYSCCRFSVVFLCAQIRTGSFGPFRLHSKDYVVLYSFSFHDYRLKRLSELMIGFSWSHSFVN